MTNSNLVEAAKTLLTKKIQEFPEDPYLLKSHVPEVENWALKILKNHHEANKEITLLSVWLHDIGHYPLPSDEDHAIRGERIAKEFLTQQNTPQETIEAVAHAVRAHRCKDVQPQTIEAKILACADSASHFTDVIYIDMAKKGKAQQALEKIKRDLRDTQPFPEIHKQITPLADAWKKLLTAYLNTSQT